MVSLPFILHLPLLTLVGRKVEAVVLLKTKINVPIGIVDFVASCFKKNSKLGLNKIGTLAIFTQFYIFFKILTSK